MRVINSVGRNIFKAIHEGKWLYIEYKNKSDTKSNEILLSYHYRCNKAIIDFSNKKYYNNKLKIKTVSQSTQPLTFVDIQPENQRTQKILIREKIIIQVTILVRKQMKMEEKR